jgi:hypothetical protein
MTGTPLTSFLVGALLVQLIATACRIFAASLLFRADALEWFDDPALRADAGIVDPTDFIMLILGGVIAGFLFIFVNHSESLGGDCYYFGAPSAATSCINPAFFRVGWMLAVALLGGGIYGRWKHRNAVSQRSDHDFSPNEFDG